MEDLCICQFADSLIRDVLNQVQYELAHNSWHAAYLDMQSGLWYGMPVPEGGLDILAACVWQGKVYVLDSGANLHVMVDSDSKISWKSVELRHVGSAILCLDSMKLSGLVGSVWLLVSSATPGPINALQLNLADCTLQRANIDPLGNRRDLTVEFLSHTVVGCSMVVTGLLGSPLSHGQSQSATFLLETVPGQVQEPVSGSVTLLESFSKLRDVPTDSADIVTLSVQGKQYKAHKLILAARSPYFAKMFESGMLESVSNSVTITDIPPEVMDVILDFIYGKTVKIPNKLAVSLFKASDRLEIPDLTEVVVGELKSEINAESVAAILQIAGRYDNSELWNSCIYFASSSHKNLVSVVQSPDYLHLMEATPDLAQKFQLDVLIQGRIEGKHVL